MYCLISQQTGSGPLTGSFSNSADKPKEAFFPPPDFMASIVPLGEYVGPLFILHLRAGPGAFRASADLPCTFFEAVPGGDCVTSSVSSSGAISEILE